MICVCFQGFGNINKASLNTLVYAGFFIVIWCYFHRRTSQKLTFPLSSLLKKIGPWVIKCLRKEKGTLSRAPGLVLIPLRLGLPWALGAWVPPRPVMAFWSPGVFSSHSSHGLPWDIKSPSQSPFYFSASHSSCSGKWLSRSPLWNQISLSMWELSRSSLGYPKHG